MNLQNKKILVTGADGFIGSQLTETLVKNGFDVRAFVLYNAFNSWGWLDHSDQHIRDSLDVFAGDIRDPHGVLKAMQHCDVVLHLAALIGIPYSYHSPDTYVDTNIKGTLNLLQAARHLNISKFVHTSTSEVYGTAKFIPIHEEHPLQGQSPYAASKIGADQMAMAFHQSFQTPVSIIRPFNTYGPRQSARAVIPTIISQIANGQEEIKLGALTPTRDFNFIDDTVSGFIAVAESDASLGQVINIGSGFAISVGDTAMLLSQLMAKKINIINDTQRIRPADSEVKQLLADNGKAKKLTDWAPHYRGIEGLKNGFKKTIDWFTDPSNLANVKSHLYNV
ncbi:MAG: SDR family NAD(P)-dependent oxidoreductase [Gammaproteobacteria bacterium]|nr:SDR family NAD(P)-dependent oxidoreductase [Gammaproteobacteria bacterium]